MVRPALALILVAVAVSVGCGDDADSDATTAGATAATTEAAASGNSFRTEPSAVLFTVADVEAGWSEATGRALAVEEICDLRFVADAASRSSRVSFEDPTGRFQVSHGVGVYKPGEAEVAMSRFADTLDSLCGEFDVPGVDLAISDSAAPITADESVAFVASGEANGTSVGVKAVAMRFDNAVLYLAYAAPSVDDVQADRLVRRAAARIRQRIGT